MKISNSEYAFLELVKAGLWVKKPQLLSCKELNFEEIYRLAIEQSVVGLVAAGIEQYEDGCKKDNTRSIIPQDVKFAFIGQTMQLEQRNRAMNRFIAWLLSELRTEGIDALLVKGQGVAQCYEIPLWRASGDVDLLLNADNYEKAKYVLCPIAEKVEEENHNNLHQGMIIKGFEVELHVRMPFLLSECVDKEIDSVIEESINGGKEIRIVNGNAVLIPTADRHVILVFTHFLHHFFIEGVGLRQICDWCRMLWIHKDTLNYELLELWIQRMGLKTEWRTFAALAVNTLGMPLEAMPFYEKAKYDKKALRVLKRIMKTGNMGHNNDLSYRVKNKGIVYYFISLWRRLVEFISFIPIFPVDAPRFFVSYLFNKTKGIEI